MSRERVEAEEALFLLEQAPQIDLMSRAHAIRVDLHGANDVTFVIDTNPNYTNVCVTDCTFCSFYRKPGHSDAYVLSPEAVGERVAKAQQLGATTVLLQGGHNPELPFSYYLELIECIKSAANGIHLHLFSPSEIVQIAETAEMSWRDVLTEFAARGQMTMPGGGAEILVDKVRRKISPKKISADTWLAVMRTAHEVGMKTSATMTYGHRETPQEIIEHLMRLRDLQDETGGFYAFIPWSFKPGTSPLSRLIPTSELPSYYPRVIAIARLVLDNVPHIQASWFGEGWRAGQLALNAGADDFGGLLLEENVLFKAGHDVATTMESVLITISEAGFTPIQRNTNYEKKRSFEFIPDNATNKPAAETRKPLSTASKQGVQ